MEDQLLTCALLSRCSTGPISLYENHECRSMKTLRLVEAMEDQLLTYALLLQCGTGPILRVKSLVLSMDDGLRHNRVETLKPGRGLYNTRCLMDGFLDTTNSRGRQQ